MEIRRVIDENFKDFMECAGGMAYNVVLPMIYNPSMKDALTDYLKEEHLRDLMEEEEGYLWLAYEEGRVAGVSLMEGNGHITVLYVYPMFQQRGIAKGLVAEMKNFAKENLGLEHVTVNVMPSSSSFYFEKLGFERLNRQTCPQDFISMKAQTCDVSSYKKRIIPTKVWLPILIIWLLLLVGIVIAFLTTL